MYYYFVEQVFEKIRKGAPHMTNNEKFNQLINQCESPRLIYNALLSLALSEPCVHQSDNALQKKQVVVGKLATFFDEAESS